MTTSVAPRLPNRPVDTSVEEGEELTSPLAATVAAIALSAPPTREVAVGTTLRSRYSLDEIIGQGGDSIVFRATDLHRDSTVAIKVLRPEHRLNPNALRRLKRQFQHMQRLSHQGIARVFDLDRDGDIWFISMELVAGRTVNAWIHESAHLGDGLRLIGACAEALEHAHSRGILHGDLKPSNVLVAEDGSVKLIDFGSAPSGGEPGAIATASFASPQVLAGGSAEERDDIFSLACLSYVILSKGRRPFAANSSLEPAFFPDIPVRLYEVLLRGLAAERELRPNSVREFANELVGADLSPIASHAEVQTPAPVDAAGPAPEAPPPARMLEPVPLVIPVQSAAPSRISERRITLIGLVVIILGATLLIWQAMQHRASGPLLVPQSAPAAVTAPVATTAPTVAVQPAAPATAAPEVPARPYLTVYDPGTITFESSTMNVTAAQALVAIPIRRLQATRSPASVAWIIEGAAGEPNLVRFIEGQTVRSIFIPLSARPPTFTVALRQLSGGPGLGPVSRITVRVASK